MNLEAKVCQETGSKERPRTQKLGAVKGPKGASKVKRPRATNSQGPKSQEKPRTQEPSTGKGASTGSGFGLGLG